jgi:hypothetical protein
MSKITITPISNSVDMSVGINRALQQIASVLNNQVLFRANPEGTPNTMISDLDMGGYDLLNMDLMSPMLVLVIRSAT